MEDRKYAGHGLYDDRRLWGSWRGHDEENAPRPTITDYIGVPSVDEYAAKVEKLGGKIIVPKKAIPGMGFFAICMDTENNAFGIWETNPTTKQ
jgi:predicted enzyme related to lactoylglutathione lyase